MPTIHMFRVIVLKAFLGGVLGIVLCATSATAQSFRAHALLGLNAAQIDGDGLWGYNQGGILGGVKVALPLSDILSVQAGMLYSAKGSRSSEQEGNLGMWRLAYLELPVELEVRAFEKVYCFGGLSSNYLIRARSGFAGALDNNRQGLRDFDFNYTLGVVYRFADNAGALLRASDALHSASEFQHFRNRTLGFALVYYFSAESE